MNCVLLKSILGNNSLTSDLQIMYNAVDMNCVLLKSVLGNNSNLWLTNHV